MAVATTTTRKKTAAPPITLPGAHPNGTKNQAKTATLPGSSFQMPPGETFWEQLANFKPDEWQYLFAYLWRNAPEFDSKFNGKPTNIKKYARKFDLETIKEEQGSGGYRIDLIKIDPSGGPQKRIAQEYFVILDMNYPPLLPPGDWLNWPQNKEWAWAKPALEKRQQEAIAEGEATKPSVGEGAALFSTILEGVRTLRGESGDNNSLAAAVLQMVQSNQERMMALSDPTTQLQTLQSLLTAIQPKPDNSSNLIVQLLMEDLKETRKEMAAMRERQAERPDLISQLIDAAPKLKGLADSFGLGAAAAVGKAVGTDWGGVAVEVIKELSSHVPSFVEAYKISKVPAAAATGTPWTPAKHGQQPAQQIQQRPAAQQQPAAAGAAAPSADPEPEPDEATRAQMEEDRAKMTATSQKFQALLTAATPFLIDHYRRNLTGYDLRDWFFSAHGQLNWSALRDEVGAKTLTQIAMSHPVLRANLSPPDKLFAFLNEFFTNPGEEDADVIDPDPDNNGEPGGEGVN